MYFADRRCICTWHNLYRYTTANNTWYYMSTWSCTPLYATVERCRHMHIRKTHASVCECSDSCSMYGTTQHVWTTADVVAQVHKSPQESRHVWFLCTSVFRIVVPHLMWTQQYLSSVWSVQTRSSIWFRTVPHAMWMGLNKPCLWVV